MSKLIFILRSSIFSIVTYTMEWKWILFFSWINKISTYLRPFWGQLIILELVALHHSVKIVQLTLEIYVRSLGLLYWLALPPNPYFHLSALYGHLISICSSRGGLNITTAPGYEFHCRVRSPFLEHIGNRPRQEMTRYFHVFHFIFSHFYTYLNWIIRLFTVEYDCKLS